MHWCMVRTFAGSTLLTGLLTLDCTVCISCSTSRLVTFPRKMAATVRYLPRRGSMAAMRFLGSKPCETSSGTDRCWYARLPGETRGAKPQVKKCRRGKGTMLTPSLRRSELSWPGNRRVVEQPLMAKLIMEFRSVYFGSFVRSVRWQMSYSASLSKQNDKSAFSTS